MILKQRRRFEAIHMFLLLHNFFNRILLLALSLPGLVTALEAQHFGEATHPMNRHSDNMAILSYWGNTPAPAQRIFESAYNILSAEKTATFMNLSQDKSFMALCRENGLVKLGGPMIGNVSQSGVSVWLRTIQPSKVEVEVRGHKFRKTFGPVYSSAATDLSAVVEIRNLQPSTVYLYSVLIDGKELTSEVTHQFRTSPAEGKAAPARIAFGSCPHRWGLGNETLFNQISSRGPDALLLLGDIAVQDRDNHFGLHRADYLLRDFLPAWERFSASVPVYATWDDHDYFDDDKSGIPEGFILADKEGVWEVFRRSWVNPSYGLGEKGKGVFTRTRIGPFDIIMTDNRYFRTGEKGSFLGSDQMKWLKKQLLDCKGPFIILSCGTMWSDYVSKGKDSWGANDPEGREEIFSFIEDNNIAGVVLISGDRHGARAFTVPRDSGFRFYEFEAASLGARVGPPATNPAWNTQLHGVDGTFAFGEFTYIPGADDPGVKYRLIRQDGVTLYEVELRRSELTPRVRRD